MAAPNIVGITTVTGATAYKNLTDTSATTLLTNAASSNQVYKVNSIVVANDDGSSTANITCAFHDAAAGGGTGYKIAHQIDVVAKSTLVLIDKASTFYLEEDRSIVVPASAGNDLDVICGYEVLES